MVEEPRSAVRREGRLDPIWLAVPGVIFLGVFMLAPTVEVLTLSVTDRTTGAFSFAAFARIWNGGAYFAVLSTTFLVASWTTALCLMLGYPLAYWLSNKPLRHQRIAMLFVLLPFWTSALIKNFAWLVLLGRNGFFSKILGALGVEGGDKLLFSQTTVVFAMTHTLLPLAIITMLPVMNRIDRQLCMAAATLGANSAQRFWRVFCHLSIGGVASAGLLVFVASLGFFITPALVGGPQETMVGQLIILQINELQNWQLGCALATILLVSAIATCLLYDRLFGLSSGNPGRANQRTSDRFIRWVGFSIANIAGAVFGAIDDFWARNVRGLRGRSILSLYACNLIAVLLAPIVAFVPMAFTESSFLSFPPQGWGLKWFELFRESPLWVGALIRSFGIGVAAATMTVIFAAPAALGVARSSSTLSGVTFMVFLMPMIVPSIVIAIALFNLFAKVSLIASDIGIVIGHTVIALPIVFVVILSTFKRHDWRLESAASTLGAGRLNILRFVTLPLVKGGIAAGFVTGFLQSFEELTVAIFVGGGVKTTLPKQMWDGVHLQVSPIIAAASVVVLGVIMVIFALVESLRARSS